jgi:hypothetical protein
MSKPYLVINLIDGNLGVIRERANFEDALNLAVEMVKEQCGADEDEIRKELENDMSFLSQDGGFSTFIGQPEDD